MGWKRGVELTLRSNLGRAEAGTDRTDADGPDWERVAARGQEEARGRADIRSFASRASAEVRLGATTTC